MNGYIITVAPILGELSKNAADFLGSLVIDMGIVGNVFNYFNGVGAFDLLTGYERFQLLLSANLFGFLCVCLLGWILLFLIRLALSIFR